MASLGAALKTAIVASGVVSTRVYQDRAPADALYPQVIYHDFLSDTIALRGDADVWATTRILQADLYVDISADLKSTVEKMRNAIDGYVIGSSDEGKGVRFRVVNVLRTFWDDTQKARYVFDIRAVRRP